MKRVIIPTIVTGLVVFAATLLAAGDEHARTEEMLPPDAKPGE